MTKVTDNDAGNFHGKFIKKISPFQAKEEKVSLFMSDYMIKH